MNWLHLTIVLIALSLAGCREQVIFVDITQDDAARKMAALDAAGIRATVINGTRPLTVSLTVPERDVLSAVQLLTSRQRGTGKAVDQPSATAGASETLHPSNTGNLPDNCSSRTSGLKLIHRSPGRGQSLILDRNEVIQADGAGRIGRET